LVKILISTPSDRKMVNNMGWQLKAKFTILGQ
jgi:hypothetical protein